MTDISSNDISQFEVVFIRYVAFCQYIFLDSTKANVVLRANPDLDCSCNIFEPSSELSKTCDLAKRLQIYAIGGSLIKIMY